MLRHLRILLFVLLLPGIGGCATMMAVADYNQEDMYYAGTRLDFALLTDGSMHGSIDGTVWLLALIDLPLSLTLDTALLPVFLVVDLSIADEPDPELQDATSDP